MDDQSPARTLPESGSDQDPSEYWCYHCVKSVAVETLADLPDVVCYECKNGFVESISAVVPNPAAEPDPDPIDDPTFGNQFIQVLRLIAQAAREEDAPPPSPPSNADYLRIELDGWDDDNNDEDDDDDDEHSVEVVREEEENNRSGDGDDDDADADADEIEVIEPLDDDDDDDDMRRRRHDTLRLRLSDFASRTATRRNRILDWAEILMGLEDHSIELRLQLSDSDTYIGNPGDYVDASGYEALLQNLADSDSGGGRGPPPAAKSAVEALKSVVIEDEGSTVACAICKDLVNVGEAAKTLPCGHGYHGECIEPWLGCRNSCPVCRFELPTDDPNYEKEKRDRERGAASSSSSGLG
ncbi:E3 ubiquitin-protein ligase CIP8-like [Andrographis paniculata]|uniref:E3 ubiquitin-protein ligase CIP8-like n=1 Tax=Andrographis paniculata TaxID=175694 RepID=UPI0021E91764|nr:E3 ubiquitin-protein ligase CIP8-like [Andrographis paniculata]